MFSSITPRWVTDQETSRSRQVSPSGSQLPREKALAFHISWNSSSLLLTCR